MKALLALLALVLCLCLLVFIPPMVVPFADKVGTVTVFDVSNALMLCAGLALVAGIYASKQGSDGPFLVKLFVSALLVRLLMGALIFGFSAQEFFGGDAYTYDFFGYAQLRAWAGDTYQQSLAQFMGQGEGPGWGMIYMVAAIYSLVGRNLLAVQFVNAVVGAITPVILFLCAQNVFSNARVARMSAFAAAFYPSLVLWSSQGLKDGPVVFFLTLSILATLKLGQKFSVVYLVTLVISLFGLLSMRFYVFYMIVAAIAGAFILGMREVTGTSVARQLVIVILLGLSLTYLGVTRYASLSFQRFGSLEQVQRSRLDASTSAKSGFAKDVDVSTTQGALTTIPIGLVYLIFAPFPWQLVSLRQSLTLPEMVVWWVSFPMLILGIWFSIKHRLRMISPILTFTIMLSLAYSVFQGNVGTAYRQRAQLLVFYFIFTAVGYELLIEKREEQRKRGRIEKEAASRVRNTRLPVGDPTPVQKLDQL